MNARQKAEIVLADIQKLIDQHAEYLKRKGGPPGSIDLVDSNLSMLWVVTKLLAETMIQLATETSVTQNAAKEKVDLVVGQKYKLALVIEATCVDRSDGHGVCFELKLDQRNYQRGEDRTISVDQDEVLEAACVK